VRLILPEAARLVRNGMEYTDDVLTQDAAGLLLIDLALALTSLSKKDVQKHLDG